VIEANGEFHNHRKRINTDPHGGAWLIKVRLTNASDLNGLMDAAAYEAYIAAEGKEPRPDALPPEEPAGRQEMLAPSGQNHEELFSSIPNVFGCENAEHSRPYSEAKSSSISRPRRGGKFERVHKFLGAGRLQPSRSVVTDAIIQRGSSLPPNALSAEITQGTLAGMLRVSNADVPAHGAGSGEASMYDGSTATTEAVLMAER